MLTDSNNRLSEKLTADAEKCNIDNSFAWHPVGWV